MAIHHPFAWQQGSLTYILSWVCQLALAGLRYLRVPQSCGVQGVRDGVTLSGRVCVPLYVLDRNEGFSLNRAEVLWGSLVLLVQGLRDGATLRGRVCVPAYVLDRIVGFPEPLYWHTKPVHLISPHFYYPTHTLNIFPTLLVGIPSACNVRLAPTRRQPWYHTHTPSILNLSASRSDASSTLFARITHCLITGYDRLDYSLDYSWLRWIAWTLRFHHG